MTELTASQWLERLPQVNNLAVVYGRAALPERKALLARALEAFIRRHGDAPIRMFRAPGRINLRGMHVDTHGGYLNLMTHQREIVLVCRARRDSVFQFSNADATYSDVTIEPDEIKAAAGCEDWQALLHSEPVQAALNEAPGDWRHYLKGAVLRAGMQHGRTVGMDAVIASDLPHGAALSSSAALCVVVYLAACAMIGHTPWPEEAILCSRDAEWYTGARTGTSDQAAVVLGGVEELVNVALFAEDFSIAGARRVAWPRELSVLVCNSHTRRSLSGAALLAYTRNRLAYSVALQVFRQEMANMGFDEARWAYANRLSNINDELLGGSRFLSALLMRVPECLELSDLRNRYDVPNLDALRQLYFGALPESEWPDSVPLRGPLVYGLAESQRAERFAGLLESQRWEEAGALMTIGHNGDRVSSPDGAPYDRTVQVSALAHYADGDFPLDHIAGDYGASSPVLDAMVDCALEAGALGAGLTGAGIAGSVLALCRAEEAAQIRERLTQFICSESYATAARLQAPVQPEAAVMENHATACMGELLLP